MSHPSDFRAPRLSRVRVWACVLLGVVTGYLLLERSHAEEVGTGSRVLTEILRGDRVPSPLTWVAFGLLALLLSGQRLAARVAVEAPRRS